jgi:hypothetical protein
MQPAVEEINKREFHLDYRAWIIDFCWQPNPFYPCNLEQPLCLRTNLPKTGTVRERSTGENR